MKNKKPVIAFFDIETTPLKISAWKTWEADSLRVEEEWYILSFAVKLGDSATKVYSLNQFKSEKELVKKLWEYLDKSDILVSHNGDRFDIKKSNARFMFHGFQPPSPYRTIDTLKVAKKYFAFTSNRLDALGEYLGVGRKVKHKGMDLWFSCMKGDSSAFSRMRKYNKQDVDLLYAVYNKLKPYMENHPSMTIYQELTGCPTCASTKLQSRGFGVTKTGKYRRFHCQDCGAWSRGKTIKTKVEIVN